MARTKETYWSIGRNGVLRIFDAADLSKGPIRSFDLGGGPTAVARLGSGRVVVCLSTSSFLFSSTLEYLGGITHAGTSFLKTAAADIHPDRAILFDQNNDLAIKIDTGGSQIKEIWRGTTGRFPRGGKVDANGDVWSVGKIGNNSLSPDFDLDETDVSRLDGKTGRQVQLTTIPHIGGRGLAIDSNGDAWVTIFGNQVGAGSYTGDGKWVYKVNPGGGLTQFVLPTENIGGFDVCGPFGIAVDDNDHKYVACSRIDQVIKIDGGTGAVTVLRDVQGDAISAALPGPLVVDVNRAGEILCSFKADQALLRISAAGALIESTEVPGLDKPEDLCDNTGWHTENILFPGHSLDLSVPESIAQATSGIVEQSPWIWLVEFQIDDATALRMTPSTRPISFEGNLYYPRGIGFSGLTRNTEGNLSNLTMSMSPIDLEVQQLLDDNDGFVDLLMVLRLIHSDILEMGAALEETFQVVASVSDWKAVAWTLGAFDLFKVQFPRQLYLTDHCRHRYKGAACGYVGELPDCKKTYAACFLHGDDEVAHGRPRLHPLRGGFFPDIPERKQ